MGAMLKIIVCLLVFCFLGCQKQEQAAAVKSDCEKEKNPPAEEAFELQGKGGCSLDEKPPSFK